jgi:hypothetical protein
MVDAIGFDKREMNKRLTIGAKKNTGINNLLYPDPTCIP